MRIQSPESEPFSSFSPSLALFHSFIQKTLKSDLTCTRHLGYISELNRKNPSSQKSLLCCHFCSTHSTNKILIHPGPSEVHVIVLKDVAFTYHPRSELNSDQRSAEATCPQMSHERLRQSPWCLHNVFPIKVPNPSLPSGAPITLRILPGSLMHDL